MNSKTFARKLWAVSPEMMVSTAAHLAALVVFVVLAVVDQRVVNGQVAWIKPAKFAISGAIYMTTLAWVMTHIEGHRRALKAVSWATGFVLALEVALIAMQAGRGVVSHFNTGTTFDKAVFGIMGAAVLVAWGTGWTMPVLLVRQRFADPALASALRTGVIVSMIGAGLGGLMTAPTRSQMQVMQQGGQPARTGAHAVGVPDGGRGLPLVGWSTEGGDLRIGHFFGLHALQVVPLVGLWIRRRGSRRGLSALAQRRLVRVASAGYLGFIGVLIVQALRAEPIIAPGGVTLALLGAVAAATAIGWALAGRESAATEQRASPPALARAA
ncbi:MAG TPA: hypothetical protein VFA20_03530 [Myxococcaceae bacterium]|nr:hypothetical protein [Myxococcaceae bacterium]